MVVFVRTAVRRVASVSGAVAALSAICLVSGAAARTPFHQTAYPSGKPRGWVIVVHAGGWQVVGPGMPGLELPEVDRLLSWGYATLNIDYHRGAAGLTDLLHFYDRLHRRVGAKMPICLDGSSSGGHLALMAAQRRRSVSCVVTRAAPTLLTTLHGRLRRYARRSFAHHGGLARWSPALYPLRTPLLLAHARSDPYVSYSNATAMKRRASHARLVTLRRGHAPWVHTYVRRRDEARLYRRERRFLAYYTRRR
jgi:fermentation-respiration switch protein FrsA (DUF1100 family)